GRGRPEPRWHDQSEQPAGAAASPLFSRCPFLELSEKAKKAACAALLLNVLRPEAYTPPSVPVACCCCPPTRPPCLTGRFLSPSANAGRSQLGRDRWSQLFRPGRRWLRILLSHSSTPGPREKRSSSRLPLRGWDARGCRRGCCSSVARPPVSSKRRS